MRNDPYYREDPGVGLRRKKIHEFELEKGFNTWRPWRTNDGRIIYNPDCGFSLVENPFDTGNLIMLSTTFDPKKTGRLFGGFGMRAPIYPAINLSKDTFIEFDFYYPKSAADKYRKFEIWSTSTGGEGIQENHGEPGEKKSFINIRTSDLEGVYIFNLDYRCGYYNNETWFKKSVYVPVPLHEGSWDNLNIDLHTEFNAKLNDDLLMIGNICITQLDSSGTPIPDVVNEKFFYEVTPLKQKYNPDNGYFLIGTEGKGSFEKSEIAGYHFDIFVDHRNLKPERHLRPPKWLKDEYPGFLFLTDSKTDEPEWNLPTDYYKTIRDKGLYAHGHCLAWNNQSPLWMKQLLPENILISKWIPEGNFYTGDVSVGNQTLKINKKTARRIYFNHIMYEMRHFMSTDPRYGSSIERGVIPFYSFDVVNVEIHESLHSMVLVNNKNEWKSALRNTSWFMAMTDNDLDKIDQHYMYLLFKYAHIAVPNFEMARKFKEHYDNPDIVPEYMKLDDNDNNGCIDAFVQENPPLLIYNDYEFTNITKVRVAYNMIQELNTAWKNDPLYDGRNLIECIGIQGHYSVSRNLASQNYTAVKFFAQLIDDDLLDSICFSEIDMKMPESAPGGRAAAPDVLNQKQADAIGYQFALLFKLFEKYKAYIDHVIFWAQFGYSFMENYIVFDHEKKASQAYYAIMDPDRFIAGHSYLDDYFKDELNLFN